MADLSDADAAFLQHMIPHHQSAITMSQNYLDHSPAVRRSDVSDLARGIITAQAAEIAKMRGWLTAAGKPASRESGMGNGM